MGVNHDYYLKTLVNSVVFFVAKCTLLSKQGSGTPSQVGDFWGYNRPQFLNIERRLIHDYQSAVQATPKQRTHN